MSRIAYDAFKQGGRVGTVVAHSGALIVQEGASSMDFVRPAPDYQQYAFVNGL